MAQISRIFPRNRRLCSQADYKFVFSDPAKYSTRYFTILYRPNGISHARLGLAISKKTVKKAVDRNRVKRFIRESFRLSQQNLDCFDIVVLAKRDAAKLGCGSQYENQRRLWIALHRI